MSPRSFQELLLYVTFGLFGRDVALSMKDFEHRGVGGTPMVAVPNLLLIYRTCTSVYDHHNRQHIGFR